MNICSPVENICNILSKLQENEMEHYFWAYVKYEEVLIV